MSSAPTLTVSDSGIRIVASVETADELHRHFKCDGVQCVMQPGELPDTRKIVFLSPYAIDKIVHLFRKWEEERQRT